MSFLYKIVFLLLLALLIFLSVVRNKGSAKLHAKLHPPKKEQEEFLKACELYLNYRKDPQEHPDPEADAKYDAAVWIQKDGFLPAALDELPVQRREKLFQKPMDYKAMMREEGEPTYMTYEAIRNIRREAFLEARKQDQLLSGYTQDSRFWNGGTFNAEAWEEYCAEMDDAFYQLADQAVTSNL